MKNKVKKICFYITTPLILSLGGVSIFKLIENNINLKFEENITNNYNTDPQIIDAISQINDKINLFGLIGLVLLGLTLVLQIIILFKGE